VKQHHDTLVGVHGGKHSTFARLSRHYFWPYYTNTVARYVHNCYVCSQSKSYREGKQGLLKPLPIPDTYWTSISINFITPLPKSKVCGRTYRHLMVVVNRLSKKKKFVPLTSLDTKAVIQAFIEYVWREEGYPVEVISDRALSSRRISGNAFASALARSPSYRRPPIQRRTVRRRLLTQL
jgi:hypothetical protein